MASFSRLSVGLIFTMGIVDARGAQADPSDRQADPVLVVPAAPSAELARRHRIDRRDDSRSVVPRAAVVRTRVADSCSAWGTICGQVKNRTGRPMRFTLTLGSKEDKDKDLDHRCDVWNRHGGDRYRFWQAWCHQLPLNVGVVGGNFTAIDVDAFTFPDHGYHQRFTRFGKWHWRKKGVWTKIRNGENADCGIGAKNEIWCTLLWQAR